MRILCLGDSNTWGYNPETQGRYRWRWTKILDYLMDDQIIEEGMCGRTCIVDDVDQLERCGFYSLKDILKKYKDIDCIIVMLGTNDLMTSFCCDALRVAKGYREYIRYIKKYSKCQILMVSPITLGEEIIKRTDGLCDQFNDISYYESLKMGDFIKDICLKEGVLFLDASKVTEASLYDDIHLTQRGHYDLAKAIFVKLNEMKEHR